VTTDDDRAARALRTQLLQLEFAPPRVDLADVVRDGRRARSRRRTVTTLAATVLVAAGAVMYAAVFEGGGDPDPRPAVSVPPDQVPLANCSITELPRPEGRITQLSSVDETGRFYVGLAVDALGPVNTLLLWRDGALVANVDVSGTLRGVSPVAVNSTGVVVGYTTGIPGTPSYGWAVRDGQVHRLPVPSGHAAALPVAINERGDIMGVAGLAPMGGPGSGPIVVWPAGDWDHPQVRAEGQIVVPQHIAADGTVVGKLYDSQPDLDQGLPARGAYAWTADGQRRPLPMPAGWSVYTVSSLRGDVLIGTVYTSPPRTKGVRPARWNLRTGTVDILENYDAWGTDGTTTGWRLIQATVHRDPFAAPTASDADGTPILVVPTPPEPTFALRVDPNGQIRRLPGLPGAESAMSGVWISDDGHTIVGSATLADEPQDSPNANRPVVWHCT
jgi:hypothetical protein